jgi:major vault protein
MPTDDEEISMVEERRPARERELVLAPNEYAYVLDTTKGHINCYVGPNKTSLAQTDQPVVFDEVTKRFTHADDLATAVQLLATAPANWYLVLKNPAIDNAHPRPGMASSSVDLKVGRKVIVHGPQSFALWPGQMARVIAGHSLQSNQYLMVRVYDAAEASARPAEVLGRAVGADDKASFEVGQKLIIRGNDVSFYMPPNGVEVVADDDGRHARDAVTLQRLEYCVLIGENGKKRTLRGEAVVFPEPNERFYEEGGRRKFKGIELSEVTGLHVKVIAPYVDDVLSADARDGGTPRKEGDELFLTGGSRIYFPREEHAIIKGQNGEDVHHAVAIPKGEGRYVLDRKSGSITVVVGPRMFLPDPRREVIARRVLSDRECFLYYPGNDEALQVNRGLRGVPGPAARAEAAEKKKEQAPPPAGLEGSDSFSRKFVAPKTMMLDTKYEGAVGVDVWSGFAICVKDRSGERRVVRGPQTALLAWDETLEALNMSTGTPKTTNRLLSTVFLKTAGNQVSDIVDVVSSDLVRANVRLAYRVSFETSPVAGAGGEGDDAERWFRVDNYVKLLCDHAGSMLKGAARKTPIRILKQSGADLVRDAILGAKTATGRVGLIFADNGMRVTDVEVLDINVADADVGALLVEAQVAAVKSTIEVAEKESSLADQKRIEDIDRQLRQEQHQTLLLARALELEVEEKGQLLERTRAEHRALLLDLKAKTDLAGADTDTALREKRLSIKGKEAVAELTERSQRQDLDVALLTAQTAARVSQAQAFSPDLTAALQRLGDAQLLSSLAENFGELAAVEGKGLLETARKFLDFVPQASMPVLRTPAVVVKRDDAE